MCQVGLQDLHLVFLNESILFFRNSSSAALASRRSEIRADKSYRRRVRGLSALSSFCEASEKHMDGGAPSCFIQRTVPLELRQLIVYPFANADHKMQGSPDASQRLPYNACGPFGWRMASPAHPIPPLLLFFIFILVLRRQIVVSLMPSSADDSQPCLTSTIRLGQRVLDRISFYSSG